MERDGLFKYCHSKLAVPETYFGILESAPY